MAIQWRLTYSDLSITPRKSLHTGYTDLCINASPVYCLCRLRIPSLHTLILQCIHTIPN
jgi:hypothetical protein